MGKIVKALPVIGDRTQETVSVLLDSGAGSSIIRRDVAERLCTIFHRLARPRTFCGVNGEPALAATHACMIELEMKGKVIDGFFYVVDRMPRDIILGVDFMQRWVVTLDLKHEDYTVGVDPEAIEIV